ncbi:hypothetical protein FOA52_015283 [Chlamydomonas sp. UWO 241]|nr:hypothetical protein FOA52_015283 [Chlamydomonas sp. UWO 241]
MDGSAVVLEQEMCALKLARQEVEGAREEPCDDYAPDSLTCAICLCAPAPVDLAVVKGCEHSYCVNCILHWASYKETPLCPQCKVQFNYLYVHRQLDGTISDYAIEESIVLLQRATWFTQHMDVVDARRTHGQRVSAYDAEAYEEEDEVDEDDELEDYYFSSAAGRARVVLGNRRFGENGFMRGGRLLGRPRPNQQPPTQQTAPGGKGKGAAKAAAGAAASAAAAGGSGGGGSSGSGGTPGGGGGTPGGGGFSGPPGGGGGSGTPGGGGSGSGALGVGTSGDTGARAAGGSGAAASATPPGSGAGAGASGGSRSNSSKNGRHAQRSRARAAADSEVPDSAHAYMDRYLDEY